MISVFAQTSLLISSSSVQTERAWKALLPGGRLAMGQACFGENHGPPAHSPAAGGVQRMCWGVSGGGLVVRDGAAGLYLLGFQQWGKVRTFPKCTPGSQKHPQLQFHPNSGQE